MTWDEEEEEEEEYDEYDDADDRLDEIHDKLWCFRCPVCEEEMKHDGKKWYCPKHPDAEKTCMADMKGIKSTYDYVAHGGR